MNDSFLKKDHILFSSASEIQQICSPLIEHFGIGGFSYVKIFSDMSRVHLDINPQWVKFYYNNFERYLEGHVTGSYHWESGFSQLIPLEDSCIHDAIDHDLGDGVVLSKRFEDYTELVFVTHKWTVHRDKKVNLLMRNMDLLESFVGYFRERANEIISLASQSPIILPFLTETEEIRCFPSDRALRRDFSIELAELSNKKKITRREIECIYYTSLDMSAKEVARELKISPKTVERHLENAKIKCGCHKKSSLVRHLLG